MESQIAFLNKYGRAYVTYCKSICREYDINQTEFDILMFFGNNPEYDCAKDIVDVRKIKANLVSINVDKDRSAFNKVLELIDKNLERILED